MYLIIGANGFLGSYIINKILETTQEKIIAVTRGAASSDNANENITWMQCDISKKMEVDNLMSKLAKYNHKWKVVYLAAYHHPDLVEKNPEIAWDVNITSLSYFMNALENVKCFFYPSTDSVYGESINGYKFVEEDDLHPVNCYGKQKLAAESLVISYGYNVVRYPFLIGASLLKHKKHFYDEIVENLQKGNEIKMFEDSIRSALSFNHAASLLVRIMEKYDASTPSLVNISGSQSLSKYDIGLMIARKYNFNENLVIPVSSNQSQGIFTAKRAKSTLLNNTKLKEYLGLCDEDLTLTF